MKTKLTKADILAALTALNNQLVKRGTTAEICLYGGTSMVLAFNARLSTKDVDAVFHPKDIVRKIAEAIAQDLDIQPDWINDGVKGFLSPKGKFTSNQLPQFSNLQITRPTAKYLFAMKCMAARAPGYDTKGDRSDIIFLMKHLKIKKEKEAFDAIEEFYEPNQILPKTQFLVMECLSQLNPNDPV